MDPLILSARDLEFLLYEWLDVARFTDRDRYRDHSRETFDQLLELSRELAEKYFAPHNREADLHEPSFDGEKVQVLPAVKRALDAFAAAGLVGAAMDERVGGMQLPYTVFSACMAWFYAANVATISYPMLTMGNANLLAAHAAPDQIDRFVRPMVEGRFFGTMALSEPQAGSSLADITTKAVPQDDGSYRLFGRKMWISGGDHELADNIVHLVLARIPGAPAGTRGISLFIVPKYLVAEDGSLGERNDVTLAGINHKMGWRGTVNTAPVFGDGAYTPGGAPGAVGYLVGEANRGLAYMFHMMNEARLGVGLAATALGYTGYLKSLAYARSRPQGRPVTATGQDTPQLPIVRHPDVRRMLLAQKSYAEGALALQLYCSTLIDEQRSPTGEAEYTRASTLLRILTPIAKSWPSQWCLAANDLAIQVHGGAGYTRDYDVEQHYRDNRLNPIHEGTHGIQSMDLLGRAVTAGNGGALALLLETIGGTVAAARTTADAELGDFADALAQATGRIATTTATLWKDADPALALANSSAYLEAFGHVVLAWIWLSQAVAAHGRTGSFYDGKRAAARYFFRWELPRTTAQFDLLDSLDRTTLDLDDECL
ncbi:acyl-CoA dehydrogenase [Nocardia sp. CDC159]|uniref:Acyl-CoA dehydrogenase n=1 Tax=Nocardia pulmonis TaxID=2951408 RepID=A0A9X2IUQ2_9NOCA|nr:MULTISPECIES: acyl-CoA dehydrogenase [Nocardia]MCM6773092.1 acyl-CoA dehydrogenase [Nocardia pulmonis]MCM6785605.1 acyl-CoA dehydrogenase [Nocardia sp. CDC159]